MNLNAAGKDYSILYVDDEDKSLKYFSRYFSSSFRILTASNTTEARKTLDDNASDIGVLISDQRMPVEKGVELLRYSRENYPLIVRLLTTAYSDLGDAIEAVNRGEILRYIKKPWDINYLEMELRQSMRYFLLNKERDTLRKEKISIIHRLREVNRTRDLIAFSAGMTHISNSLHAVRAFLLQLPSDLLSANTDFAHNDMWELLTVEIQEVFSLAEGVFRETGNNSNFGFEKVDIIEKLNSVIKPAPITVRLDATPVNEPIEANIVLIERLLNILFDRICRRPGTDNEEVKISIKGDKTFMHLNINSTLYHDNKSAIDLAVNFLSAYYICYHHGGSMHVNYDAPETEVYIRLPYRQNNAVLPELPRHWQDEIFHKYEILSG